MDLDNKQAFEKLVQIMHRLRQECPWDQKQTHESLAKYCLEEAYEVLEAIERYPHKLKEELGDLLMQVMFHAELASETQQFNIHTVIEELNEKLIRRHPHIFEHAQNSVRTAHEVEQQWEQIKKEEAKHKSSSEAEMPFSSIPLEFPALLRAFKIGKKSKSLNFDWSEPKEVLLKVNEELTEYQEALSYKEKEEELGDCLFAMAQLCRHEKIDPEQALRKANVKFEERFAKMQKLAKQNHQDLQSLNSYELEDLWTQIKKNSP